MLLRAPLALSTLLYAGSLLGVACTPTQPEPEKKAEAQPAEPAQPVVDATPAKAAPPPAPPLPVEPSPDIKFDEPFNGTPVATSTTEGGIAVSDFVIGTGADAIKGGEVEVHYTGYLTDGTVFDTSVPRKRPFTFELGAGRVIKGWDEGVVGMKVGGKRKLVIPAKLGYAERRAGKIPPNSTLIFTIELLSVTPPLPPPQPLTAFEGKPLSTKRLEKNLVIAEYKLGDGPEAKANDTVSVHYRGTLKDGTEFDSSLSRPKPLVFVLGTGRVIKGWDLGIAGMKVGGLRKLTIPAELAYGERARGKIPANADLTFTVELMAIKPAPTPPGTVTTTPGELTGETKAGTPGTPGTATDPKAGTPGTATDPKAGTTGSKPGTTTGTGTTGKPGTSTGTTNPGTTGTGTGTTGTGTAKPGTSTGTTGKPGTSTGTGAKTGDATTSPPTRAPDPVRAG
jgi:peptidylprolyl isomerase